MLALPPRKTTRLSRLWHVACIVLPLLSGCGPKSPSLFVRVVTGTQPERVAEVTALISRHSPLPSQLLDAHGSREQTGDGKLGPADCAEFYALQVPPAEVAKWQASLPPLEPHNTPATYAAPQAGCPSWWINRADFPKLQFFSAAALTGRTTGWLGIAPDGRVFIHAHSM